MAKKYEYGPKSKMIRMMAECAIRDQTALIDALHGNGYYQLDDDSLKAIKDCETVIRDFERLKSKFGS